MTIIVARQAPGPPVGLKLVLVLVLAAGLAAWFEPRLLRDPLGVAGALIQRMRLAVTVTELPGLHGDIMAVERAVDSSLWVAGKYDVVRYPAGAIDRAQRLLNPDTYRGQFHRRMDALSALHLTAAGDAWVGTWYGEVLRYRSGSWALVSDRGIRPTGRIHAIADAGGSIYVAARGLWTSAANAEHLGRVEDFPDQEVTALARSPAGELMVGTASGVLARRGGRWRKLWPIGRDDGQVNALFYTSGGKLLVATRDGYLVVDPGGRILYRELEGKWVTGFAQLADGELWVATWKSGVHVKAGGAWRHIGYTQGLGDDSLSALAVDHRQRLWLGIHADGVAVAEVAPFKRFAVAENSHARLSGARLFADACAAATSVLGNGGESGAIAVATVVGQTVVFFNGRQVCPAGVGHRRDAGTLASVADGTVRYRYRGKQKLLPLPARAVGAMPSAAFVDSSGALWLGFRKRGLFVFKSGRWRSFAGADRLIGNAVQAISEDKTGAIWVASHPRADGDSGRRSQAGVHRYDGRRWTHFKPTPRSLLNPGANPGANPWANPWESTRHSLVAGSANAIRVLGDGRVAIATNGGLSIFDKGVFDNYLRGTQAGLESNFIADVVEDGEGRLWMTHGHWGHGITWKSGFLFHNRSARDGLFHDGLRRVAFDADGNVWMQSSYGETAIYPLASVLD